MNRADFQRLSNLRLQEARALQAALLPEGAYYLAGYAVECALKACIAKRTQQHDFPEKGSQKFYSHDLDNLLELAKLRTEFENAMQGDPVLKTQWIIVQNWSEESRYDQGRGAQEATDLLSAVENPTGGVLPWLRQRW
jgi:hypothetical protein